MHTPVLVAAYLSVSVLFVAYTCVEILRANTRLRFTHWLGIAFCTVWPALVAMALVSALAGRLRLKQS
jgi:Ca2+/Na+ antiporter